MSISLMRCDKHGLFYASPKDYCMCHRCPCELFVASRHAAESGVMAVVTRRYVYCGGNIRATEGLLVLNASCYAARCRSAMHVRQ